MSVACIEASLSGGTAFRKQERELTRQEDEGDRSESNTGVARGVEGSGGTEQAREGEEHRESRDDPERATAEAFDEGGTTSRHELQRVPVRSVGVTEYIGRESNAHQVEDLKTEVQASLLERVGDTSETENRDEVV